MLKAAWRWLLDVPRHPIYWKLLLAVNLVGSLYGFWWYREQILRTPPRFLILVPDSPGSTFLFCFLLIALLYRASPTWVGWLGAFAYVSNMKYGLWTALVLPMHAVYFGRWTFDDVHLSLSHFGMWLQAILFLRHYRPTRLQAAVAWAWMYIQDYADYWHGLHPTLPSDQLVEPTKWIAITLSTVWGLTVFLMARPARR